MRFISVSVYYIMKSRFKLLKIFISASLLISIIYAVFFLPPQNSIVVWGFIVLSAILTYFVTSLFLKRSHTLLLTFFIASFLSINYLSGFQFVNTILLVCFIIGIAIFIKK